MCIWLLLQAFLAVVFRATAGKRYGFTAFGMAALAAVAPFTSDPFDTLKDAVFGGLCLVNDNMLVKLLGVFSWIWLLIVHAKLVSEGDTLNELVNSYLSVYAAPFEKVVGEVWGGGPTLFEKGVYGILLILFMQTTTEKVRMIMWEDSPQAGMAFLYWIAVPTMSPFIILFNLGLPAIRILFATISHDFLKNMVQTKLGDELHQAMVDNNVGKASYWMGYIDKASLEDRSFGDVEAQVLAKALKANTSLKEIRLYSNQIGDEGAKALAEAIRHSASLKEIRLGANQIGDVGATALAEALNVNKSLTTIVLEDNQIGPVGAKALAEALKVNTVLTTTNLYANNIGDDGAAALAQALKVNNSLTFINLESNEIGPAGAKDLAEALKTNTSLTTITLHTNKIGDDGAKALAEALKTNTRSAFPRTRSAPTAQRLWPRP